MLKVNYYISKPYNQNSTSGQRILVNFFVVIQIFLVMSKIDIYTTRNDILAAKVQISNNSITLWAPLASVSTLSIFQNQIWST